MKIHDLRPPLLALGLLLPTLAPGASGASPAGPTSHEDPAGENLSAALDELRAETGVPGLVALAYQDGEVIAWGEAGLRAQGGDAAMSIDDPVHLGSCSKAMTATLVARLVEQGALSWETTLAEALPELAPKIDPGYHGITPLTFLQHRAGIAERKRLEIAAFFPIMASMEGTGPEVRRRILEQVLALPPSPPAPGTFDYSNYGYMTVGLMLQGVTGQSWEELMVEHLFGPMGLRTAGLGSPAGSDVPVGHRQVEGGWEPLPPGPGGVLPEAMAPAGLVNMSLADWARFVADHLAGERGEDGFLSAKTYAQLHASPGGSEYAAGWGLTRHFWDWGEGTVLTHDGSDGTWHSLVFALPEWDLTILCATNCAGDAGGLATGRARELLLSALDY